MSIETPSLQTYNRRLLIGSVIMVLLFNSVAAFLPFHFAAAEMDNKTGEVLKEWSTLITVRAQEWAAELNIEQAEILGEMILKSESTKKDFTVTVRSIPHESELARSWLDDGMPGFDIDEYIISGKLPERAVGNLLWTEDGAHSIAVLPGSRENSIDLMFGPEANDDLEAVLGSRWNAVLIRHNNVVFSRDKAFPVSSSIGDEKLSGMIEEVSESESVRIANLSLAGGRQCCLVPLKDYDQWDVTGVIILVRRDSPFHQSLQSALFAILIALLTAGAFTAIGYDQWRSGGKRHLTLALANAAFIFLAIISVILLLVLGKALSDSIAVEWSGAERWLAANSGNWNYVARDFLSSLQMLGVLALYLGALAVALIFINAVRKFQNLESMRQAIAAAGFLAPASIYIAVFVFGPVLFALYISFFHWEALNPIKNFAGLGNYLELFSDPLFWGSLWNTLIYSLHVPFAMGLALMLALALQRKFRGVTILRTLFFLPYVTSFVAISTVWQWLYNTDFGMFNYLLSLVGLGPINWLSNTSTAMISVMIMSIWIQMGYMMVVFIAGLQGIPKHLYEAATIDGASRWKQFRLITIPLLRPTIFFVLVTSVINSFQVFTYVYVMTEGGPLHSTEVLVYHIYKNAWEYFRMGYASAISWILFLLIMAVTLVQFTYFKKRIEAVTG